MGNRKLPFGYRMEAGEITVCEPEANLVRCVFDRYVLGDSYTELTAMLKKQPILYQSDKLWNKNMVARMLEDSRYIGDKEEMSHPKDRNAKDTESFVQRNFCCKRRACHTDFIESAHRESAAASITGSTAI